MDIVIFLIIIIILYILYINIYNNDDPPIKKQYIAIENKNYINTNTNTYIPNFKIKYNDAPDFRGITDKYNFLERDETGGSKPFKHIHLDDNNITNNITNYRKYNSYRIKPHIK